MAQENERFKIKLSREVSGTVIEVSVDSIDSIDDAYRLLEDLVQRAEVANARNKIDFIWDTVNGAARMNEFVYESTSRVALALFKDWPNEKRFGEVCEETGLSQGSVGDILAGRRKDVGKWFEKFAEGWKLTKTGLSRVIDTIIPELTSSRRQEPLF